MKHRCRALYPSFSLLGFALCLSPSFILGADLSQLDRGRNVRLSMVGQGLLCHGTVEVPSARTVIVRLSSTSADCGGKGELIQIKAEDAVEIVAEKRLTQGRVAAKLLLGAAGMALLATIPLTGSDPENRLLAFNPVVHGFILYGAWRAVPRRLDYLVVMTCVDRRHCVSRLSPP